ncbi:hypothetical protein [Brevundimonas diminuta]|uniref:hypothetical protein n=1 Tax=Brevundimonas diminuta TaxID=293 RepID=UPI0030F67854
MIRLICQGFFSRLDVLESKISPNYKQSLEKYILTNYSNESKRSDVHLALSYYLAHLTNNGYSRQYIYDVASDVFFTEDISRASHHKIFQFFEHFDLSNAKFEVYFQLDDLALSYLKDVYSITHVPDDDIPPAVNAGFVLSGLPIDIGKNFVRVEKRARDMFSAARDVSDEIGSISAVCVLSAWEFELPLPRDFCVYAKRKKQARGYTIDSVDSGGSMKIGKHPARGIKDSKLDVKQIKDHFDTGSVERIHNSLSTVHSAMEDKNYDSRLISIWSAFETILISPPSSTSRITHYVDVVAPCVIARYCERNILSLYNFLVIHHRKDFIKYLEEIEKTVGSSRYIQFASLLFDNKFDHIRIEFEKYSKTHPLLSYRISNIIDKFSTPEKYTESLKLHRERIEWHLHRIYRARNQLVHAGRAPPYLEVLTINAFEYYRNAVRFIIYHGAQLGGMNDIDTVVESIGLKYQGHISYVNSLKSLKKFSSGTIARVFAL